MSPAARSLVTLASLAAAGQPVAAQAVWQADVRIQTLDVAETQGALSVQVTVLSDRDDTANNVRLEVFLPVRTGSLRMAGGCQASPSAMATLRARVSCALGDLQPGQARTVWLTTSLPPQGVARRVGVIAFSDTPDPVPGNNYGERVIP